MERAGQQESVGTSPGFQTLLSLEPSTGWVTVLNDGYRAVPSPHPQPQTSHFACLWLTQHCSCIQQSRAGRSASPSTLKRQFGARTRNGRGRHQCQRTAGHCCKGVPAVLPGGRRGALLTKGQGVPDERGLWLEVLNSQGHRQEWRLEVQGQWREGGPASHRVEESRTWEAGWKRMGMGIKEGKLSRLWK